MEIRPIRNDDDHAAALREIEKLWGAAAGTEEGDKLDILSTLVEKYEDTRWPSVDISDPMVDRHRLIGECRKLKQDGVDLESVVAYLRDEGCWKIDCIAILREVLGISLGDAKRLVHGSSTWRDVREQDDTFHDELIDALVEKPETRKVN
jgi:ribosomal protein L7/L12